MKYGKAIELFLVDGTADGIVTAELSNWNGKAIKIPRSELIECKRDDIKSAGVYFLFCKEEDDNVDSVYIGEAECVRERLVQHLRDYQTEKEKYYWNTAVIFIGNDLNKALIRYLENELFEIAKVCKRYEILTKNTFKNTVMKESSIASMGEFIANVKTLLNTMGYKVLEPVIDKEEKSNKNKYLFINKNSAYARGLISNEGFVVLEGSKISDNITPSFKTNTYLKLREKLINLKLIVDSKFVKDYIFNSPSAAASVVIGNAANGRTEWKYQNGKTLKDVDLESEN